MSPSEKAQKKTAPDWGVRLVNAYDYYRQDLEKLMREHGFSPKKLAMTMSDFRQVDRESLLPYRPLTKEDADDFMLNVFSLYNLSPVIQTFMNNLLGDPIEEDINDE